MVAVSVTKIPGSDPAVGNTGNSCWSVPRVLPCLRRQCGSETGRSETVGLAGDLSAAWTGAQPCRVGDVRGDVVGTLLLSQLQAAVAGVSNGRSSNFGGSW